jgi:ABC-type multidrug transport system fused ATPase/permease subunit
LPLNREFGNANSHNGVASDAEVREAVRLAQIDHFIEHIPGGYEAQVGERKDRSAVRYPGSRSMMPLP